MNNQILLRVSQQQADRIELVRKHIIERQRADYRDVRDLIGRYPRWGLSDQDVLLYCLGCIHEKVLTDAVAKSQPKSEQS